MPFTGLSCAGPGAVPEDCPPAGSDPMADSSFFDTIMGAIPTYALLFFLLGSC